MDAEAASRGAASKIEMEDAMSNAGHHNGRTHGEGAESAPLLTLPYADFSHALIRAHHDAFAMAAANRQLADSLRAVVRRQQDLAFELAEAALGASQVEASGEATTIFERAAKAVRELGEAIIDAQLDALRMVQTEADRERPAFAFPAMVGVAAPKAPEPRRTNASQP
jgi:hypothetical protein